MSWRSNAQRTGENAAPLAHPRRWGGGGGGGSEMNPPSLGNGGGAPQSGYGAPPGAQGFNGSSSMGFKRDRDPEPPADSALSSADAPRKRRSRWGDAPADAPAGVATALGANMSAAELDRYAINVRIAEIQQKLVTGNVVPPERERSPSPPPTYDGAGRRTNTREVRYRKKLDQERVDLIDRAVKLDPNYKPPADYHVAKRNMRPQEKVWLPIKEFPEINFFGLLVGPRGNTLKGMERESGAKISIRGRGSVKEGKGRPGEEEDEEMHCIVQADDLEKIKVCIKAIQRVIEVAASTPEAQNDHKRNQLRELAALNGTLRDDEGQICQNCGQKGHRRYACPEERNVTAHIICHRCGGQGHLARDCTQMPGPRGFGPGAPGPGGAGGPSGPGGPNGGGQLDSEYASLMAELGEGGSRPGGPGAAGPDGASQGGPLGGMPGQKYDANGKKIPPWRDPEMWNPPGGGGRMGGPGGPGYGPRPMGRGMGMGYQHGGFGGQGNFQGQDGGWGARNGAQQGGYGNYQQQYPAQTGQDGQPDYSAQWAEYYAQQAAQQGQAGASANPGGGAQSPSTAAQGTPQAQSSTASGTQQSSGQQQQGGPEFDAWWAQFSAYYGAQARETFVQQFGYEPPVAK